MPPVVETISLTKQYILGKTEVQALKNVTLSVEQGEFSAIAGPSGSGKTTLLNLIGCLDTPTAGSIKIGGEHVSGMNHKALADIRNRKIGFIFQTFNLIPVLTVYENVEFPLLLQELPVSERKEKIVRILDAVGIGKRASHKPEELSGGQQQRVAIARALVKSPQIVLADEPTANLDSDTGKRIIALMQRLNSEHGTTFIFSTHDNMVMAQANRVVKLQDGRIMTDNAVGR